MADRIVVPRVVEAGGLEGRLTAKAPYGEIIRLRCCEHPKLVWQTKNISPLGCRKIFFDLMRETDYANECDCPISNLRPEDNTGLG